MDYRCAEEVVLSNAAHRDGNGDEHRKYGCAALPKLNDALALHPVGYCSAKQRKDQYGKRGGGVDQPKDSGVLVC